LSSLGSRPDETDSLKSAAWLTKPVRQAQLNGLLKAVIGRNLTMEQLIIPEPAAEPKFADARVLLVEDNAVNQEVARRMLSTMGLRAQVAENGVEAVERIQRESFDLVLMDCQMPLMDGYEATEAIRRWEQETHRERLAIVAMTANAMQGDRERCLAAGMDDYVAKPIKRAVLSAALARWLKSDSPSAGVEQESIVDSETISVEQHLDMAAVAQLRELFDGDITDVVTTYVRDTPEQLKAIANALAKRDYVVVQRAAHSLKSSSFSLGAHIVGKLAEKIEAIARSTGDLTDAAELHVELQKAADDVIPQLIRIAAHGAAVLAQSA
jgi:CheY-like chemotaxis protein/HPt (histidine-containing phosphotransfer) domain-containing protein